MMRDLLRRGDVLGVIADYRSQLEANLVTFPKDLAIHNQLEALRAIERRIVLLARGGLRVIEGGKQTEDI